MLVMLIIAVVKPRRTQYHNQTLQIAVECICVVSRPSYQKGKEDWIKDALEREPNLIQEGKEMPSNIPWTLSLDAGCWSR